jgi:hypothetical protein
MSDRDVQRIIDRTGSNFGLSLQQTTFEINAWICAFESVESSGETQNVVNARVSIKQVTKNNTPGFENQCRHS